MCASPKAHEMTARHMVAQSKSGGKSKNEDTEFISCCYSEWARKENASPAANE